MINKRNIAVRPVSDTLVSWDSIPMCNPSTCFLGDECTVKSEGKCSLHVKYQDHIIRSLMEDIVDPTAEQLLIIGMHLVPLYSQLLAFKMYTKTAQAVITDDKGMPRANPLFREVQIVMRAILDHQRQLKKLGVKNIGTQEDSVEAMLATAKAKGNPEYYNELMEAT